MFDFLRHFQEMRKEIRLGGKSQAYKDFPSASSRVEFSYKPLDIQ